MRHSSRCAGHKFAWLFISFATRPQNGCRNCRINEYAFRSKLSEMRGDDLRRHSVIGGGSKVKRSNRSCALGSLEVHEKYYKRVG